jgi:hypothetical protein
VHIDHYEFGRVRIGDKTVTSDIIVFPEHFEDHWWRKQGHELAVEDLASVTAFKPEVLVVGTGYFGRMQVPQTTEDFLAGFGVQLLALPTSDAIKKFNTLQRQCAAIVGAFHLTC